MKIIEKLERNDMLLKNIASGNTGTPAECAMRMGICKSTLAYYIEYWRSLGAQIIYNYKFKTYEFAPGFDAKFLFCLLFKDNEDAKKVFGNFDGIRYELYLNDLKSSHLRNEKCFSS
jgi:hypothetical protein